MSDAVAQELRLISTVDGVLLTQVDLTGVKQQLQDWLSVLTQALADHRLQCPPSLRDTHVLARRIGEIDALLTRCAEDWMRQWAIRQPGQRLAQDFEDKIMLLVYGKFNAGKSSLCNLLAERFAAHGSAVVHFHLESGRIVWSTQPFQEGATETTARLQGVCLGARLVLLDTPGLHSVTSENAALTQRFTDSADAVLWLTSSTSPGQVQELNELARELHRHKPLLPVITRSDVIEEDEADGEIVKLLRNKTPTNRRLQEDDVHLRAREKLLQMGVAPHVLKPSVSVSAHVTREQGQTVQALCDGGFMRLYAALRDLVEPARIYKQRKPAEVLLHHLDENVLGDIYSRVQPALSRLLAEVPQERERMQALHLRLANLVWRQVAPELPLLLEQHAADRDLARLCHAAEVLLHGALTREVALQLGDHDVWVPGDGGELDIGLLTSPMPWTVSHERLHDALQKSIHRQLKQQLDAVFRRCANAIDEVETATHTLKAVLVRQATELHQLGSALRRDVTTVPEKGFDLPEVFWSG